MKANNVHISLLFFRGSVKDSVSVSVSVSVRGHKFSIAKPYATAYAGADATA